MVAGCRIRLGQPVATALQKNDAAHNYPFRKKKPLLDSLGVQNIRYKALIASPARCAWMEGQESKALKQFQLQK